MSKPDPPTTAQPAPIVEPSDVTAEVLKVANDALESAYKEIRQLKFDNENLKHELDQAAKSRLELHGVMTMEIDRLQNLR